MKVRFRTPATQELEQAIEYYLTISPNLGAKLLAAVEKVGARIAAFPSSAKARPNGIRNAPVPGFPYALRYRIEENELIVYAFRHDKREPDYWVDRIH